MNSPSTLTDIARPTSSDKHKSLSRDDVSRAQEGKLEKFVPAPSYTGPKSALSNKAMACAEGAKAMRTKSAGLLGSSKRIVGKQSSLRNQQPTVNAKEITEDIDRANLGVEDEIKRIEGRRRLYLQQAVSAKFLTTFEDRDVEFIDDETGEVLTRNERRIARKQKGVCICRKHVVFGGNGVEIHRHANRARYKKLTICGRVWQCPVCSSNIARQRQREVRKAVEYYQSLVDPVTKKRSHIPVMMTLTLRHVRKDDLRTLTNALKEAFRVVRQSHAFKDLIKDGRLEGSITAFESTWSAANGWHPHLHICLFMRTGTGKAAKRLLSCLRAEWSIALKKLGRDCGRSGFRLDPQEFDEKTADSWLQDYLSKFGDDCGLSLEAIAEKRHFATVHKDNVVSAQSRWDMADELTGSMRKTGPGRSKRAQKKRSPGFTPWQILSILTSYEVGEEVSIPDAPDHKTCIALWLDFQRGMFRKNQLTWSQGLKSRVGVNDKSDEQLAEKDDEFDGTVAEIAVSLDWQDWNEFCNKVRSRTVLLEIFEKYGPDGPKGLWSRVESILGRKPNLSQNILLQARLRDEAEQKESERLAKNRKAIFGKS